MQKEGIFISQFENTFIIYRANLHIVAVDYDAGAPKVNQENRIKLMLSIGKEKLEEE